MGRARADFTADTAGTAAATVAGASAGPATTLPRGPHRRRGTALEDAILAAAYDELSEVGYTAFSVEAVAARARTGKASIYRRWPTKQDLLLDAVAAGLPTPQQCGLADVIPDNVTTVQALHGVACIISRVLSSPAGDAMRAIKCEAAVDPELARAVDERFQAPRREALLALLERGVQRGEVRPEAVCDLVADVLPAMLFHQVVLRREPLAEREVRRIVDIVLVPLVEVR